MVNLLVMIAGIADLQVPAFILDRGIVPSAEGMKMSYEYYYNNARNRYYNACSEINSCQNKLNDLKNTAAEYDRSIGSIS